jgi:transmembrane sensor
MPTQDYLQQLLRKYHQGKCTPEEARLLWQWLFLLDVRDQQELKEEEERLLGERLHDRIFSHIGSADAGSPSLPFRRWRIAIGSAAAIVTLAVMTLLLRHDDHPFGSHATTAMIVNSGPAATTIYLPDSTEVVLNRLASVQYDQAYNHSNRAVRLTGEAYFVVRQDPRLAFIVQTGAIQTQALGTSFNVEYYNKESEIRVSLLQGKVRVSHNGDRQQAVILDPGQMVQYDIPGDSIKTPIPIAASNVLAWTNGGLVFNDIPLAEALKRVEEHYHLHLQYSPSQTNGKRITTVFSDHMSWQAALSNILFLHNMHYTQKDTLIFIK